MLAGFQVLGAVVVGWEGGSARWVGGRRGWKGREGGGRGEERGDYLYIILGSIESIFQ